MQEETRPPKEKKTIYDVSYASIFARNFLAGFSHALGMLFLYLIVIAVLYYATSTIIVPRLQSVISTMPLFNAPSEKQEGLSPGVLQELQQLQLEKGSQPESPTESVSP